MSEQSVSLADIQKIFSSGNVELILQSLEHIREVGNEQIFDFLIQQLAANQNADIQRAISACLADVHNPHCAPILVKYVQNPDFAAHKSVLFSIAWQSALDFSELAEFAVESICNDDFATAFEAHTLLEHISPALLPEQKQAYTQQFETALQHCTDTQKEFLLRSSIDVLN
ncbi:MAG: hypothetical protein LBU90_07925 [Bacteroidales bacterium]|jgi:hypothetical protein|nr:hypothetical protein [Bacteroidales bacterium]